jgi:ring-1,2-phenylacetyl-CoA epoxidase subunit PaaB
MQLHEADGLYHPYEVFVQYNSLEHHQHVGSVLAPSADVALHLARENFLRRDKAVNVWVVKKDSIYSSADEPAEFFAAEFDRSYRRVDGYSDNARKWKVFKQRALHLEDILKDG